MFVNRNLLGAQRGSSGSGQGQLKDSQPVTEEFGQPNDRALSGEFPREFRRNQRRAERSYVKAVVLLARARLNEQRIDGASFPIELMRGSIAVDHQAHARF